MATEVVDELVTKLKFVSDRRELDRTTASTDHLEKRSKALDKTMRTLNAQTTAAKDQLNELHKIRQTIAKNPILEKRIRESKQALADMAISTRKARDELVALREEEKRVAKARTESAKAVAAIERESARRIKTMQADAARTSRERSSRMDSFAGGIGNNFQSRARAEAAAMKSMRASAAARIEAARNRPTFRSEVRDRWESTTSPGSMVDRVQGGAGAIGGAVRSAATFGAGAIVGGAGALAIGAASTGAKRETTRAGLETAVGVAKANDEFERLANFAKKTPYDLDQVVNGFVKLENMGLKSGERAMKSYGDTAGAMGKDLNEVVEAVADASVGEFERLKEFGIKAKTEGDNVTFLFRGVSTTVKKEQGEIEDYLIKLGETNFAGGMERQSQTLTGQLSNLGDAFSAFLDKVFQSGLGDAIKEIVADLTGMAEGGEDLAKTLGGALGDALKSAYQWIKSAIGSSDEFAASVKGLIEWVSSAASTIGTIVTMITDFTSSAGGAATAAIALGGALTMAMGPLGLIAAAGAAAGYGMAAAFDWATNKILGGGDRIGAKMQELMNKAMDIRHQEAQAEHDAAVQALDADQKGQDAHYANRAKAEELAKRYEKAELAKLGKKATEKDKLAIGRKASQLRSAVEGGNRQLGGGTEEDRLANFEKYVSQKDGRTADPEARFAYLDAHRKKLLPNEQTEYNKLSKQLNKRKSTGSGKAKAHKAETKFEADVESQVKSMSEKAGEREGLRAAARGATFAEQKAAAKAAQDKTKTNLMSRVEKGEALPGELRRGMLKVAGMDDVAGRSTPPPIAIVNVRVESPQVNVNFTGPVQADRREMSAKLREVVREELAQELQAGISEVAAPAVW